MNAPLNVVTLNTPPVHVWPSGMDIERLPILIREPRYAVESTVPRIGLRQALGRHDLQANIARADVGAGLLRRRAVLDISRDELRMEE